MSNLAEFADWKQHPITKRVFEALRQKEIIIMDKLAGSAGEHPPTDRYLVGYIAAVRDFYLIDVEDAKDD